MRLKIVPGMIALSCNNHLKITSTSGLSLPESGGEPGEHGASHLDGYCPWSARSCLFRIGPRREGTSDARGQTIIKKDLLMKRSRMREEHTIPTVPFHHSLSSMNCSIAAAISDGFV